MCDAPDARNDARENRPIPRNGRGAPDKTPTALHHRTLQYSPRLTKVLMHLSSVSRSPVSFLASLAAVAALACPSFALDVLVVDALAGSGADYTTINSAVSAAADGDVILIRTGSYFENVSIDQRSLVLHADTDATVEVLSLVIRNVRVDQRVVVRGIAVGVHPSGRSVSVATSAGLVWLEDCTVVGQLFAPRAVVVQNSDAVVLRDCDLASGPAAFGALDARLSTVHVFGGQIVGVNGLSQSGTHGFCNVSPGGAGVFAVDSTVSLYGTTVVGGDGGDGIDNFGACSNGGEGGDAVLSMGASAKLITLDTVAVAGGGGLPGIGGVAGVAGASYEIAGGTHVTVPRTARFDTVSSPNRENATLTASQAGLAGDAIWTFYSTKSRMPLTGRQWDGAFFVGAPFVRIPNGTLPASGMLTRTYALSEIGAGVEAVPIFAQSVMREPTTGRFIASAPTLTLLLDSAY
jgi:hypothetical protein